MKSLQEIPNEDGKIVLAPEIVNTQDAYDPLAFSKIEMSRASELIIGLLESNWHGIQKAVEESPEGKVNISIGLSLKHLSPDARSCKAKLGYAVKNTDEAECFVKNPNQPDMFDDNGSDSI